MLLKDLFSSKTCFRTMGKYIFLGQSMDIASIEKIFFLIVNNNAGKDSI
jgi:hypothetical protein